MNLFEFELGLLAPSSSNSNKFVYCGLEHANEQCWSHGSPMLAANTLLITIITTESAQKLQTQLKTQTKWSRLGEKKWKNKMIAKMIAPEREKNEKTKMIAQNDRAPKWSRVLFSRLCWQKITIMNDHFGGKSLYVGFLGVNSAPQARKFGDFRIEKWYF